jgi:cbb3-type cytochrome oxidase subunit 1
MEWFVKAFLKTSLTWLGIGVSLGVAMAVRPQLAIYRTAHLHMNLLGFVAMMIFGVAYHVMPRFSGHALHSRRLAGAHWWLSNAGLVLMAGGFAARPYADGATLIALSMGGVASAAGAYAFIYNLWRTIDGSAAARLAATRANVALAVAPPARRLPTRSA